MVVSSSTHKGVARPEIAPEQLAKSPLLSEQDKVAEASRQFEAILLRQVLSASQKTVIQSKFADHSTASEIYRDLVTNQLADTMSKSGALGLAETFERQLSPPASQAQQTESYNRSGSGKSLDKLAPFAPTTPSLTIAKISSHPHE